MSQFDDDGEALVFEELIGALQSRLARIQYQKLEAIRNTGYAEYDRLRWKLRRTWQVITRQKVMSREKWNSFVDAVVEKARTKI